MPPATTESTMLAAVELVGVPGPKYRRVNGKPMLYVELYVLQAAFTLLIVATAEASFADALDRKRLGMAIAAMKL